MGPGLKLRSQRFAISITTQKCYGTSRLPRAGALSDTLAMYKSVPAKHHDFKFFGKLLFAPPYHIMHCNKYQNEEALRYALCTLIN